MCLRNLQCNLITNLTPQSFFSFDDLFTKVHEPKKKILERNKEKIIKSFNKTDTIMEVTKKSPLKLMTKSANSLP